MDKIKTLIIEDDPMAVRMLERFCARTTFMELTGTFERANDCIAFLKDNPVDLLFLDVSLPEMSGLEILEKIEMIPLIIFSTSDKNYAVEAFEWDAVDFLVKPYNYPRFLKAVEKAKQWLSFTRFASGTRRDEIYIKDRKKYVRIRLTDILYLESISDYIYIKTIESDYTIVGSFSKLRGKLPSDRFIKVHRSFIVNTENIHDFTDNSLVVGEKVIPVSRNNKGRLLGMLNVL